MEQIEQAIRDLGEESSDPRFSTVAILIALNEIAEQLANINQNLDRLDKGE